MENELNAFGKTWLFVEFFETHITLANDIYADPKID